MATSEVQAVRQEQATPKSDSDPGPSKLGHNNPDEVACYLKDLLHRCFHGKHIQL